MVLISVIFEISPFTTSSVIIWCWWKTIWKSEIAVVRLIISHVRSIVCSSPDSWIILIHRSLKTLVTWDILGTTCRWKTENEKIRWNFYLVTFSLHSWCFVLHTVICLFSFMNEISVDKYIRGGLKIEITYCRVWCSWAQTRCNCDKYSAALREIRSLLISVHVRR